MQRTAILLVTVIALGTSGCGGKPAGPPPQQTPTVGVVTLRATPVTLQTELPGRVTASETSEVRPQVSGVVLRRFFEEGATVRAGQMLYQIQDTPYRAQLANAQGQLGSAQAVISSTGLQAQRYRDLVGINAVSRQEADNAAATAGQARATVAAQRAAVEAARVNLGFTQVRAPIGGRIGRSIVTVGALVTTGQADPLTTIQRLDRVYVDVTQSAADLLSLRAQTSGGQVTRGAESARVRIILPDGSAYPIEGRFQFSEAAVDPTTGSVTLRASFPNPRAILLPGMYVRAQLVEGVRRQGILVPQRGITHDERGRAVAMVVNPQGKVEQRFVDAPRTMGTDYVVSSGLNAGDRVILDGLLMAKPGMQVKVQPAKASAGATGPTTQSAQTGNTGPDSQGSQQGSGAVGASGRSPDAARGTATSDATRK